MRLISLVVIVVLLVAGYFGYVYFAANGKNTAASAKPQGAAPIEAAKVRVGALQSSLSTIGTLKANESLMLRPEIAGRIEAIHVTEGAAAHKGDVLFSLDDRIIAAELEQAKAALALASSSYDRARMLKEKGAGTISNFDTMNAALRVAQAQVDLARAKLDKTKITPPFDGVMGLRQVSPGDVVSASQDLASFQSIHPMKAEFTLPESALALLSVGQALEVGVDAFPNRRFTGTVYAIDPQVDVQSRNISLRAMVSNEDGALKPGLFARISILVAEKADALFVPEAAIVPRGDESFVMRVDEAKRVSTVPVTLGERKGGEVEITKGLSAGDTVITAGHLKVKDGQEVSF